MNSSTHPVNREELMAYFDGELPAERAALVAAHLAKCAECTVLAADLNSVSDQLSAWQVEPAPDRLTERVTSALESRPLGRTSTTERKAWFPALSGPLRLTRSLALGLAGGLGLLVVLGALLVPNLLRSRMAANRGHVGDYLTSSPRAGTNTFHGSSGPAAGVTSKYLDEEAQNSALVPQPPAGPMIVRTAALTLLTKEFDSGRAAVERLVRQHQGYAAQITVRNEVGAGRSLVAALRVPASQVDTLLAELKKLGRVEQESQAGEEVTRQYVDLGARLSNARHTEQRLIEVLSQRTGKVADVLAVEREIARVREEIERMDAERKSLENQVSLATIQLNLSEEYKAEIEMTPPSTGTRLHNALVDGYRGAVSSALDLILLLLGYGPSLLLWGLLLFWPARFAWRRLRALHQ